MNCSVRPGLEVPGLEIRVFCEAIVCLRRHKSKTSLRNSLMSAKADNRTSKALHFQCRRPVQEAMCANGAAGIGSTGAEQPPMPDLLVPLYSLPPRDEGAASVLGAGILLRRPNPFELTPVREFIQTHFSAGWGR